MNMPEEEGWWQSVAATFWHPDFWLPLGIKWEDLKSTENFQYPDFSDVWVYPLALSAVYIFLRAFILEPIFFVPLARFAGISNRRRPPPEENDIYEDIYQRYKTSPPHSTLEEAAQAMDVPTRKVERWLRRRHAAVRATKYEKFMDCAYDLVCHTCLCAFGFVIMKTKPWLWNITLCWEDYPHHSIDTNVWWYYMLRLAYYWSATIMHVPTPGRVLQDVIPMVLHHLFTILLMVFSWTCNFVRIGTLVLLVHECADIPLLAAKMFKHAGIESCTDILFAVFVILWVLTRCLIYPLWIMHSVFFEATTYMFMPSAYIFLGLLTGLLLLNLLWTVLIMGIIIRKVKAGTLEDFRSSAEEYSDNGTVKNNVKKVS
ncbi:Ceramide synthase 5 [Halocaridina rubra]|uniref:Ceramide synthase 5 n=1 Tax=Halocaridina rubra TaxID=373956 RepID=A0AAN8XB95_HALRR